jgi:hypothetical protein
MERFKRENGVIKDLKTNDDYWTGSNLCEIENILLRMLNTLAEEIEELKRDKVDKIYEED